MLFLKFVLQQNFDKPQIHSSKRDMQNKTKKSSANLYNNFENEGLKEIN